MGGVRGKTTISPRPGYGFTSDSLQVKGVVMERGNVSAQNWQAVWLRQARSNAARWLRQLQAQTNKPAFIIREYDNLLRALEYTLHSPPDFDLAYGLIQALFSESLGFADWDRWLVYLQTAVSQAHHNGNLSAAADLTKNLGVLFFHQGRHQEAETHFELARSIYEQLDMSGEYAIALAQLAIVYDAQAQDGLALCQKALQIAHASHSERAMAEVQMNLSYLYARQHEWQKGLKAAEAAYHQYHHLSDTALATKSLFNVLSCAGMLNHWPQEIVETISQLSQKLMEMGDVQTLTKLKNNLGVMALQQQKWDIAEKNWQEALQLHSQFQNPVGQAFLLNNLGMLYTQLGEWEVAEDMLQQAMGIQQQLGDVYQWANVVETLIDLYVAWGRTAVAQQYQQQAAIALQDVDTPQAHRLLKLIQARQIL